MALVNHNGEVLNGDEPLLSIENRSFRYGDGLFESMRVVEGKVLMLERHLARLNRGMQVLKMSSSPDYNLEFWEKQVLSLCEENNCLENGRIRLTIYRKDGGTYTPTNLGLGYLIEANVNSTVFSDEDAKGLNIGVYDEIKKPINDLGAVKTANSLIYVLAGIAKEEQLLDDMIILNEAGRVAEVISSNIFVISNGVATTPAMSEGCVGGVTRDWLLKGLMAYDLDVQEDRLTLEEVFAAEEVFVTNAIQGIRPVSSISDQTFDSTVTRELCKLRAEDWEVSVS